MKKIIILALFCLFSNVYSLSIESNLSTLGYGISLRQQLSEDFAIKLNGNILSLNTEILKSNINIHNNSLGILLQYRLINNLYLEGGIYKIDGGMEYSLRDKSPFGFKEQRSTELFIKTNNVAYYGGINYTVPLNSWYISTNLGVISAQGEFSRIEKLSKRTYAPKPENINLIIPAVGINIGYTF